MITLYYYISPAIMKLSTQKSPYASTTLSIITQSSPDNMSPKSDTSNMFPIKKRPDPKVSTIKKILEELQINHDHQEEIFKIIQNNFRANSNELVSNQTECDNNEIKIASAEDSLNKTNESFTNLHRKQQNQLTATNNRCNTISNTADDAFEKAMDAMKQQVKQYKL